MTSAPTTNQAPATARKNGKHQAARGIGPCLIWRICVAEVRTDERYERSPRAEQDEQGAARAPATGKRLINHGVTPDVTADLASLIYPAQARYASASERCLT